MQWSREVCGEAPTDLRGGYPWHRQQGAQEGLRLCPLLAKKHCGMRYGPGGREGDGGHRGREGTQ